MLTDGRVSDSGDWIRRPGADYHQKKRAVKFLLDPREIKILSRIPITFLDFSSVSMLVYPIHCVFEQTHSHAIFSAYVATGALPFQQKKEETS